MHSSRAAITASSILTEEANFSPPWTTRWPTASISPMLLMTPWSALVRASRTAWMASAWVGMAISNTCLAPVAGILWVRRPSMPMRSHRP